LPVKAGVGAAVLGGAETAANGGAGGIRTLDRPLQAYNGLANRRLQPLGHSSMNADMPDARASRKRQIQITPSHLKARPLRVLQARKAREDPAFPPREKLISGAPPDSSRERIDVSGRDTSRLGSPHLREGFDRESIGFRLFLTDYALADGERGVQYRSKGCCKWAPSYFPKPPPRRIGPVALSIMCADSSSTDSESRSRFDVE
jgi:hypothetical protein